MSRNHRKTAVDALLVLASLISAVHAEVEYPSGTQDFESMAVGADINTLISWFSVNSPPESPFAVVGANDVLGVQTTRGDSRRWLRVTDEDAGNVQNRFYGPAVTAPVVEDYTWVFYVNLETVPAAEAATRPKLVIQHNNTGGFGNAWGVEFTSSGPRLVVLGIGGIPASTPLGGLRVGSWMKVFLHVNFATNRVSASVDDGPGASLPINLAGSADKKVFRFCFRGEGSGNAGTMLIDDVSVSVGRAAAAPALGGYGQAVLVLSMLLAVAVFAARARRPMPA